MYIQRRVYDPHLALTPHYLIFETAAYENAGMVVSDAKELENGAVSRQEIHKEILWLRLEREFGWHTLPSLPEEAMACAPPHENWQCTRLILKAKELYVIEYGGLPLTQENRMAVTGYPLDFPTARLYVKVDQPANRITICTPTEALSI